MTSFGIDSSMVFDGGKSLFNRLKEHDDGLTASATKLDIDNVNANIALTQESIGLKDKLTITTRLSYNTGSTVHDQVQGMCITDKYVVVAVTNSKDDTDKTWLYVFNKDSLTLATLPSNPIIDRSFGHCNGMTYNPDTNCIYITPGATYVTVLDATTFNTVGTVQLSFRCVGIGYNKSTKEYVLDEGNGFFTMHVMDANFSQVRTFATEKPTQTKQDIEVHDGLVYSVYYYGSADIDDTMPNMGAAGTVYVYTMAGQLIKSYLLPTASGAEIESMAYWKNGKFLANYAYHDGRFDLVALDILPSVIFKDDDVTQINEEYKNYSTVVAGDDLNNYTIPGIYKINGTALGSTLINAPSTLNSKLTVEFIQNRTYLMQTYQTRLNKIFTRTRDSANVWTAWKQLSSELVTLWSGTSKGDFTTTFTLSETMDNFDLIYFQVDFEGGSNVIQRIIPSSEFVTNFTVNQFNISDAASTLGVNMIEYSATFSADKLTFKNTRSIRIVMASGGVQTRTDNEINTGLTKIIGIRL
jgi:hypothetical protein